MSLNCSCLPLQQKTLICVLKSYLTDHPKEEGWKLIYKHTLLSPTNSSEQHRYPNL